MYKHIHVSIFVACVTPLDLKSWQHLHCFFFFFISTIAANANVCDIT